MLSVACFVVWSDDMQRNHIVGQQMCECTWDALNRLD